MIAVGTLTLSWTDVEGEGNGNTLYRDATYVITDFSSGLSTCISTKQSDQLRIDVSICDLYIINII